MGECFRAVSNSLAHKGDLGTRGLAGGTMQVTDFYIGMEFIGPAGFRFRCMDVGQRTILAIRLHEDDPRWYEGPPYALAEEVFDERGLGGCHLTDVRVPMSC